VTSKERVQAAFEGRPTDKVPICHISFSSRVASELLGREAYVGFGIQQWREATALWESEDAHQEFVERSFQDMIDINRLCENDIMRFAYPRHNVKPTKRIDEHTFLYEHGDEAEWRILRYDPQNEHIGVVSHYRPRPEPTLDDLERRVAAAEESLAEYHPKVEDFTAANLSVRAQQLLGHESVIRIGGGGVGIPRDAAWLAAAVLRPDIVGRHLDAQVERASRCIGPLVKLGFRHFFGGGDFAGNRGPMYSPRVFHELMLPRVQRMSEAFHRHGAYYLFASDGDLWPVADDLFGRSGVDGFYEIDSRAGMALGRLRERFPRLTLVGNISSHLVHRGTREELIEQTLGCLQEARRSKGVIVGVSNMLMPGSPVENVRAMLETIRESR